MPRHYAFATLFQAAVCYTPALCRNADRERAKKKDPPREADSDRGMLLDEEYARRATRSSYSIER